MKFDWTNWNIGGRTLFVATCIAAASMLMKWVDIGFVSQTGFSQGTFLLLGLYVYPVLMLLKNATLHKAWGLACSIACVVLTLGYINSKSIALFGNTVNAAGTGAWLFLLASIAAIYGVVKYAPPDESATGEERNA